ncbi:GNAT family N-acetyltransferase [Stappia sp.]|uniref:GNAT family N-acetyltransferase n=1 Tax=Stappia sp. TaxID=1870903 RepID=UPI0032D8DD4B
MTIRDDDIQDFRLTAITDIRDIDRAAWDALANPRWTLGSGGCLAPRPDAITGAESTCEDADSISQAGDSLPENTDFNPFITHDFLAILEESGCVGERTGWLPQHLVLEDGGGTPVAALPCYLKSHSMGEYVFDHAWADAFHRAGGSYYPKLQASVPFTPATGRRFLTGPGVDRAAATAALADGLKELCRLRRASSAHITFLTRSEWDRVAERGFLARTDQQFHWDNPGYADFDAFLADLASRKRKQIRKERREALSAGISIEWVSGTDLTEAHWDAFHAFYEDTGARKWGRPYLNRRFFSLLGERLGERVLLVMARREGRMIAGALNLIGSHVLFGRNWGCLEDHPFLHFEVCYYQAMEFAIARGLARVEAGAQGAHKLARGYLPQTTYSAHFIAHPGLREAVADYLEREREAVEMENAAIRAHHTPFKRG